MTPDLQSLADEYLTSQDFLLCDLANKQDAAGLLHAFIAALPPESLAIVSLEHALSERMARLDFPLAAKRQIPALIRDFFSWCASSGSWPPAQEWAAWVDLLEPKFLAKFRDDGSVKGETFKKNYTTVNRNDPCPCGSGKKFKKCCMGLLG
jgi:hypothetical protein